MLCKSSYTENKKTGSLQNVSSSVFWEGKHWRKRNYILSNWKAFLHNVSACVSWDAQLFCKSICTRCIGKDFRLHGRHLEDLEIPCWLLSFLSSLAGLFGKSIKHQGLMVTECEITHVRNIPKKVKVLVKLKTCHKLQMLSLETIYWEEKVVFSDFFRVDKVSRGIRYYIAGIFHLSRFRDFGC